MKALIHGERVCQLREKEYPVAAPLFWVDAPDGVTTRHRYVDGEFVAPPEPEPEPLTSADVIAERARRLAAGFDYDFGDGRGVHRIGTTRADLDGWREVTDLAGALTASGDDPTTVSIATDTGSCEVTASEWHQILVAAAAFRQPIWHASFALQAMDPVPEDYADDKWWP